MAVRRCPWETIARELSTPAAEQPSPTAMDTHCLPQARQRSRQRSMAKAALGSRPVSPASASSGKKTAMGGSIYGKAQARGRPIPRTRQEMSHSGASDQERNAANGPPRRVIPCWSRAARGDETTMVVQNRTSIRNRKNSFPYRGSVTTRSKGRNAAGGLRRRPQQASARRLGEKSRHS